METLTVANNLVLDSCGYLEQAFIADDGRYRSVSTTLRIPVEGRFAADETLVLGGSAARNANRYQLMFLVTKRQ